MKSQTVIFVAIAMLSCGKQDDTLQLDNEIRLQYKLFSPSQLSIPVGSSVIFSNTDNGNHTPIHSGGAFKSVTIGPGETRSLTFDKAGIYNFSCGNHSDERQEQVYIRVE